MPEPAVVVPSGGRLPHMHAFVERRDRLCRCGPDFDVVRDYCGFTALAMAHRLDIPLVHAARIFHGLERRR